MRFVDDGVFDDAFDEDDAAAADAADVVDLLPPPNCVMPGTAADESDCCCSSTCGMNLLLLGDDVETCDESDAYVRCRSICSRSTSAAAAGTSVP